MQGTMSDMLKSAKEGETGQGGEACDLPPSARPHPVKQSRPLASTAFFEHGTTLGADLASTRPLQHSVGSVYTCPSGLLDT